MAAMLLLFALSSANRPDNAIPNPVRRPKRSNSRRLARRASEASKEKVTRRKG